MKANDVTTWINSVVRRRTTEERRAARAERVAREVELCAIAAMDEEAEQRFRAFRARLAERGMHRLQHTVTRLEWLAARESRLADRELDALVTNLRVKVAVAAMTRGLSEEDMEAIRLAHGASISPMIVTPASPRAFPEDLDMGTGTGMDMGGDGSMWSGYVGGV